MVLWTCAWVQVCACTNPLQIYFLKDSPIKSLMCMYKYIELLQPNLLLTNIEWVNGFFVQKFSKTVQKKHTIYKLSTCLSLKKTKMLLFFILLQRLPSFSKCLRLQFFLYDLMILQNKICLVIFRNFPTIPKATIVNASKYFVSNFFFLFLFILHHLLWHNIIKGSFFECMYTNIINSHFE